MRRLALVPAILALTIALTGCGSSQKIYTLAATKSCVLQRGAKVGGQLDFVALTATGGAFKTTLSDDWVTVAFGQSVSDGVDLMDAWERFAHPNIKAGLASVLRRYDNVVTLWHTTPPTNDLALIVDCLS